MHPSVPTHDLLDKCLKKSLDLLYGDQLFCSCICREYGQTYQKVRAYLAQHFTQLPRFDLYYDAEGTIRLENQQHQIGTFSLIVVQIHTPGSDDAIGLLLVNDHVELDAVSASCVPELHKLYGYHEEMPSVEFRCSPSLV